MNPELAGIYYGLLSALCWGAGDFSGGLATRRANVYSVIIAGDFVGALLLMIVAWYLGERAPTMVDLAWGTVAGIGGVVGLIGLYRALALGKMGIVSPLSAVIAAALPVLVAIFVEGAPKPLQMLGFLLAFVAIWLIAQSGETRLSLQDLLLPAIAGAGFAAFFICYDQVSDGSIFYPLVAARVIAVLLLIGVALLGGHPMTPPVNMFPLLFLVGAADLGGNAFYGLAAQAGRLDVAAVTASLYPAATVWLAWWLLKERFSSRQMVGVVIALLSITLIAL